MLEPFEAVVVRSFRRSDTREHVKPGEKMIGPESYIRELERIGTVREVSALYGPPSNKSSVDPFEPVGGPSSASPAGPASSPQTSSSSEPGETTAGKRRRRAKPAAA